MEDRALQLTSSRTLSYTDVGDPSWPGVIFCHGAPSSRLRIAYLEPAVLASRVRVISPDRPGYGGSTPVPGRTVSSWAADVEALANALGLRRFAVAAHSSGSAYAVACAALLPARVTGVVLLGGVTDMAWPEAWHGAIESEASLMRLATEQAVVAECRSRFGDDGSGFFAASGFTLSAPDEQLYADEGIARVLTSSRTEAFRQGVIGYAQDVYLQGRGWPFDPSLIRAPVLVVHGDADTLVPLAHSRHTAELIPGAELRILEAHGHFTILAELPQLVAELFNR